MPQGLDFFRDSKEAIRTLVPVVLNQRNLDFQREKAARDEVYRQDLLEREQDKINQAARQAQDKAEMDLLTKSLEQAQKAGDTENANRILSHLKTRFGINMDPFSGIPQETKAPTTEWGTLWALSGGDPRVLTSLYRGLHPEKSDKSLSETELLWSQSGRDINKYAELKKLTGGPGAGGVEKIPPEVQAAINVMKLKPGDQPNAMDLILMEAFEKGSSKAYLESLAKGEKINVAPLQKLAGPLVEQYFKSKLGAMGGGLPATDKTGGEEMAEMPPAADHPGRTIRNKQTGQRYKSNGKEWVEINSPRTEGRRPGGE